MRLNLIFKSWLRGTECFESPRWRFVGQSPTAQQPRRSESLPPLLQGRFVTPSRVRHLSAAETLGAQCIDSVFLRFVSQHPGVPRGLRRATRARRYRQSVLRMCPGKPGTRSGGMRQFNRFRVRMAFVSGRRRFEPGLEEIPKTRQSPFPGRRWALGTWIGGNRVSVTTIRQEC